MIYGQVYTATKEMSGFLMLYSIDVYSVSGG